MRISPLDSGTLAVCAAALLAGCGGGSGGLLSASPAGPSTALRVTTAEQTRPSHRYDVLYSFKGGSGDGAYPEAALVNVKGKFYGTTYGGGANGDGTVFTITKFGTETVLYSFEGGGDANLPEAGLINVNRTLYGTTYGGGKDGDGTVFAITTSGKETVLHSFGAESNDGIYPIASLINVKGTLYSTTYEGGKNADGTLFMITPSGKETVLHSFGTGPRDGSGPRAGLLNVKGKLYGTTSRGGRDGYGTVFAITPSGTEIVLHNFKGIPDGEYPYAGLINVNGTLYGTTYFGGAYDDGTVFSITASGKVTVLHSFGMTGDGEYPYSGLINVNGTLYGTTYEGGGANGGGTVFAITTSGKETLLHSFSGSGDGEYPIAGLIDVGGTLYGTTPAGGANDGGTVFALSP